MKSKDELIENLQSKLSRLNSLDILSHLAMEFFSSPENASDASFEYPQPELEFVAGLVTTLPNSNEGKSPTNDDIKEIKEIIRQIFFSCVYQYFVLPEDKKELSPEEFAKKDVSFRALLDFLGTRGEAYPEQSWSATVEEYSPHNDYFKKKLGFTIEEAVSIFQWLSSKLEENVNVHFKDFVSLIEKPMGVWEDWRKGKINTQEMLSKVDKIKRSGISERYQEFNERNKESFIFKIEDLKTEFGAGLIDNFLARFCRDFGKINQNYSEPTDFNELNSTPILRIDTNHIFIPIPMLLWQAPLKTFHYDLIQDESYKDQYAETRGNQLERKTCEFFERIFGPENVYRNYYYGPKGEQTERDVLVIFDNKILIIECKSKGLTLLSRQGDYDTIKTDFTKAIQEAYDQTIGVKKYILGNKEATFLTEDGKKLLIKKDDINEIHVVCITFNWFASLATDISHLIKKNPSDNYPWVVSLRDLELISEYLSDPYQFLHFLRRRLILYGKVYSPDELDFVGNYLFDGLYFEEGIRGRAKFIMLSGFTEEFDKDYLKKQGIEIDSKIGTSWSNPAFENLLGSIREVGGKGHSDMILTLLELDSDTRDELIEYTKDAINKTRKDSQMHGFTMPFEDFGISFISTMGRRDLRENVVFDANLKKYHYKKEMWLGLGRDVSDPNYLINEFAYMKYKWKYDSELEKLAKERLKRGSIKRKAKVGRNAPCPCGSGLKYKKCCGFGKD